jgi:hypothetical protein
MKQKIKQFENTITQKKSDQITVEVVYLWLKLFLKSTFDILFINKIERIHWCLQNIIHEKMSFWSLLQNCVHNMNK